jgi:tRNA A37 threonylcarbamoyladenosine biosynthesis protein TsaE
MPWSSRTKAASMNIWHFDFYRFNDPREWEDAGFRDIFRGAWTEAGRMARAGGGPVAPS